MESWTPPERTAFPTTPDSFPASGVNSLAPIWVRGAARVLDGVLLAVPILIVTAISLAASGTEPGDDISLPIGVVAGSFALSFVYETLGVTLWGQTLGKLVCGVRVARQDNGRCPVWWQAGIRVALPGVVGAIVHPLASLVTVGLFAAAIFDPLRRTVPDRAAGTVVVRAR